jgi:response regulator RpfG family c-di-GMP phosphodiesterase
MTLDRILLVDDEPNVLDGYRRSLRGQFDITTATSGKEALEKIAKESPFAVVVSDMRMPEMSGVELLKRVKTIAPDSVRMMLTGNADQETAILAVNQGHIFRFLNKPCPAQNFSIALTLGARQYHLITAEKELLEKTLKGSVEMLTEILSLTDPEAFAAAGKVKSYLGYTASELGIVDPWLFEVAVMVSPIGLLTLPPELKRKVNADAPLSPEEAQAVSAIPEIGSRLLSHIPRMEEVAELVRRGVDRRRADSQGIQLSQETTFGLSVVRLFFDLVQCEQSGQAPERALEELRQGGKHDASLVERIRDALQHAVPELFCGEYITLDLTLKKVQIGDELCKDVSAEDERLLLASKTVITGAFLERLSNYKKLVGVKEPIKVKRFVPRSVLNSIPNSSSESA